VLSAVASGQERASQVAARLALGKPAVSAAVESLWPVLGSIKWNRTYHAMLATPLDVGDVLLGQTQRRRAIRPDAIAGERIGSDVEHPHYQGTFPKFDRSRPEVPLEDWSHAGSIVC